jgi:hypothetical protein
VSAEAAAAYLEVHGDECLRRCAAVLVGRAPLSVALEALPDPGDDAARGRLVLATLADLCALGSPLAERAVAALSRAQLPDGSWGSLVDTGVCAGLLARSPFARPAALVAAGDFLASRWEPALVKQGGLDVVAAYAHYFANAPHEGGDGVLQWCGRELEHGFRSRRFDAVHTARVFVDCDARVLPGTRLEAAEVAQAVRAEQRADGSWPGGTWDGLVALVRLA